MRLWTGFPSRALREERGKNRKSSGKYAVVFASATGNTALLAEAIRKAEGAEGCVYFGAPSEDLSGRLDGVETIYAGFWTDKGSCSPEMEQFLSTLAGQEGYFSSVRPDSAVPRNILIRSWTGWRPSFLLTVRWPDVTCVRVRCLSACGNAMRPCWSRIRKTRGRRA